MVTKAEAHQRLEEIARDWKPGYWVVKGTEFAVQWKGTPTDKNFIRNLRYKSPNIPYSQMEAVLQNIFTHHASRKKVKPGIFSSDATNRERDTILMFTEFPFYECDSEYAEYAWQREKPLGIERRQETKRQDRNYGTKYLAWIHPLDPSIVQNLPPLEHYAMLWSEEAQFPNAHIQWKNTEYLPFQSRDFL